MAYAAGVDVGSTQPKAVLLDERRQIVARALIDTGANVVSAAENAFFQALGNGGVQEEEVAYVVDMGGQDTKAIRVHPNGEILDFCMNDKCAAGTGRFLGAAAAALEIPLDELGGTALRSERPVKLSTH